MKFPGLHNYFFNRYSKQLRRSQKESQPGTTETLLGVKPVEGYRRIQQDLLVRAPLFIAIQEKGPSFGRKAEAKYIRISSKR
jgi:hypothetical protein